jgi:hypothetical protein
MADRQDNDFSLSNSIINPEVPASQPIERRRKPGELLDAGLPDRKRPVLEI